MKTTLGILAFMLGFVYAGALSGAVSDTASYLVLSETAVLADGITDCVVRIYIKDANNMPLLGKTAVINAGRAAGCDSVVQPAVTDVSGQCTGIIRSSYGGWVVVTVVCDGETIGGIFNWACETQEDFSAGETKTGIDTVSAPGYIRLVTGAKNASCEVLGDHDAWIRETGSYVAQSFKASMNCTLDSLQLSLTRRYEHNPAYDTAVLKYIVSVNVDNAGVPGDTLAQTIVLDVLDLPDFYAERFNCVWQIYVLSDTVFLSPDTIYWIKVSSVEYDRPNIQSAINLGVGYGGDNYSQGHYQDNINGDVTGWDMIFRVYIRTYSSGIFSPYAYDCDTNVISWGKLQSVQELNSGTVSYGTQSSDDSQNWDTETAVSLNGDILSAVKRYIRWKAVLSTDNTETSPVIDRVSINYHAPEELYFIPAFELVSLSAGPDPFSPNNDGVKDTTAIHYTLIDDKAGDTICIRIYDSGDHLVKTLLNYVPETTGLHIIEWDGTTDTGAAVTDDTYVYKITAIDSLSNTVTGSGTVVADMQKPAPLINKIALGRQCIELFFGSDETLDSWQLLRSDGDTAGFIVKAAGSQAMQWSDTAAGNDLTYYYQFKATDRAGNEDISDIVCARLSAGGAVIKNKGSFAASCSVVRCKDEPLSCVSIPNTMTFGDTVEFVNIKIDKKARSGLDAEGKILPVDKKLAAVYEINAFELDAGYNEVREIKTWTQSRPVELTLYYGSCPADKASTLSVYEWNGSQWISSGGNINCESSTISLNVSHFSSYAVMYQASENFSGVKPNPFSPNGDGINDYAEIRFSNPYGSAVKLYIFDLTGTTVRTRDCDAGITSVTWDGRDSGGRMVEGGAYIWQVEMGNNIVNGVVVVVR